MTDPGQAVLVRPGGSSRTIREIQPGEDVGDMTGDCLLADRQLLPDGAIGMTPCEQAEYLQLAHREPAVAPVRRPG